MILLFLFSINLYCPLREQRHMCCSFAAVDGSILQKCVLRAVSPKWRSQQWFQFSAVSPNVEQLRISQFPRRYIDSVFAFHTRLQDLRTAHLFCIFVPTVQRRLRGTDSSRGVFHHFLCFDSSCSPFSKRAFFLPVDETWASSCKLFPCCLCSLYHASLTCRPRKGRTLGANDDVSLA